MYKAFNLVPNRLYLFSRLELYSYACYTCWNSALYKITSKVSNRRGGGLN